MTEEKSIVATQPLPEEATVRYAVDSRGSQFVVQAFSTGLLSAFGHDPKIAIRQFQGDAEFVPAGVSIHDARLRMRILADSLEVIDDISEADRQDIQRKMFQEVLEIERFPEIIYDCPRAAGSGYADRYWVVLNGELTLHGVTRPLPISARLVANGNTFRVSGEFSLRQSEYGITLVTAAAGAIRVKDELKFTFDIVARKQE
jgi:polyisoprenoid-binding protein YceI